MDAQNGRNVRRFQSLLNRMKENVGNVFREAQWWMNPPLSIDIDDSRDTSMGREI